MAQSNYEVEYSLERVGMNTSKSPDNMEMGEFSRVVGTDGRHAGSARKFPGMKPIDVYAEGLDTDLSSSSYVPTVFFRCFSVRSDTDEITRGFLMEEGGKLLLVTKAGAASETGIEGDREDMDIAVRGNIVSVFENEVTPKLLVWESGSINGDSPMQMGPPFLTGGVAGVGSSGNGGALGLGDVAAVEGSAGTDYLSHRGIYRVGYKCYNSGRLLHTGMSATVLRNFDVAGGGDHCKMTITLGEGELPTSTDWDYVDLYRSQNLRSVFDMYYGGILFKEKRVARDTAAAGTDLGQVHDAELAQLERYDPWSDPVQMPPDSGACLYFKGCMFAAQDPDVNGGIGLAWTNPRKTSIEEFGSEYGYVGRENDGKVKRIIQVGELALAIAGCVTYRIQKVGLEVAIDRIWEGVCMVGKDTVVAVGSKVFMYTTQGMLALDPFSGGFEKVNGLEKVVSEEWTLTSRIAGADSDLSVASMSYDGRLNCVFMLYPRMNEMICLWLDTGLVTMLEGVPYSRTTHGLDVSAVTDDLLAYFLTYDGAIVQVDHYRSWDTYITEAGNTNTGPTLGGHRPLSGTIPAGETDYYDTIVAAYPGRMLWITNGAYTGYHDELVAGAKAYSNLPTLVGGMNYTLDPVAVRLRLAPVQVEGMKANFLRKVIKAMMIKVKKIVSMDSLATFRLGAYRNGRGSESDAGLTAATLVTTGTDPSEEVVHLSVDGTTLEPYFECISGKGDFDLTSLKVTGTITLSRNIAAPD